MHKSYVVTLSLVLTIGEHTLNNVWKSLNSLRISLEYKYEPTYLKSVFSR